MQVIYKGEIIELQDTIDQGIKNQDIFKDDINLEDTIELNHKDFENNNDLSKIELEKTIEIGVDKNE